eukprot:247415-Prymnesium_polylepis.1
MGRRATSRAVRKINSAKILSLSRRSLSSPRLSHSPSLLAPASPPSIHPPPVSQSLYSAALLTWCLQDCDHRRFQSYESESRAKGRNPVRLGAAKRASQGVSAVGRQHGDGAVQYSAHHR